MIFYVDGCSHSFGEEEKGIIPYSNYFKPYAKVITPRK